MDEVMLPDIGDPPAFKKNKSALNCMETAQAGFFVVEGFFVDKFLTPTDSRKFGNFQLFKSLTSLDDSRPVAEKVL